MKDLGIREIDQGGTFLRILVLVSDGEEMKNKTQKNLMMIYLEFSTSIYIPQN